MQCQQISCQQISLFIARNLTAPTNVIMRCPNQFYLWRIPRDDYCCSLAVQVGAYESTFVGTSATNEAGKSSSVVTPTDAGVGANTVRERCMYLAYRTKVRAAASSTVWLHACTHHDGCIVASSEWLFNVTPVARSRPWAVGIQARTAISRPVTAVSCRVPPLLSTCCRSTFPRPGCGTTLTVTVMPLLA